MSTIKAQWRNVFDSFSVGHQDWCINQMIIELKALGDIAQSNALVMMTNDEVSTWLKQ